MKSILIGERYRVLLEKALINHGFEPVWLPDNPLLDQRLSGHADLSVMMSGNKKLIVSEHISNNNEIVKKNTNRGYEIIKCCNAQSSEYPKDVNLCACAVGNCLICNSRFTDKAILCENTLQIIDVNQGYANCMVLAVDGHRIITADNGIAARAREHGINVLKIRPGHIRLDGFSEGFIGGASFKSNDTIYFTGNVYRHPDGAAITEFINMAGCKLCCLTDAELFDIGSAVTID